MLDLDDTIVAIASAPGAGLRGIVRLSGDGTQAIVHHLFVAEPSGPRARTATVYHQSGLIRLDTVPAELPADLYLWPTHRSYTRQPVAEFHTLAATPLLQAVLQAACAFGARLASPGEFTLRAFLAGRLDLAQAEAVLGVIDAVNELELQVALRQLAGGISHHLNRLRNELLDLLADVEAGLDFVDEDIQFISTKELRARILNARQEVMVLAQQVVHRSLAGNTRRVVLFGGPNVGKSTLFNALLGRQAAAVHDEQGTTRDYVSAPWTVGDVDVELIDTAGLGDLSEQGPVDRAAQQRAKELVRSADVAIECVDGARWQSDALSVSDQAHIAVLTRCDRCPDVSPPAGMLACSAVTHAGIEPLRDTVCRRLAAAPADLVAATAVRCRESLSLAHEALRQAATLANDEAGDELVARQLRDAVDALGQIVGAVFTEDILDRIFSRFCIGK